MVSGVKEMALPKSINQNTGDEVDGGDLLAEGIYSRVLVIAKPLLIQI